MPTAEVTQLREVAGQIDIQIGSGKRGHAGIVIGPERHGERSPGGSLGFECSDEGAPQSAAPVFAPNHQGMKLPDAPVVFGETADPSEKRAGVEDSAGKAVTEYPRDFFSAPLDGGPAARLVEAFHQESRGLLPNRLRLTGKVNDLHDAP